MPSNFFRLLALIAFFAGGARPASGYDLIYGQGGKRVTWNPGSIPFVIRMSQTANLQDGTSYASSVQAAMNAWNSQITDVQFAPSVAASGLANNGDGVNEIIFDSKIYSNSTDPENPPEEFGANTLAVTLSWLATSPRQDGTYQRTQSDILFNSKWNWNSYRGSLQQPEDIRRVAIHELGHVLGLDHPDEDRQSVTAIMNSTVSNVDALQADDITGAQFFYGRPGGFTAPSNDNFANAATLTLSGSSASFTASNVGATKESGEPEHVTVPNGASVWWKWTATGSGSLTVNTFDSHFDTMLAAYTGNSVSSLSLLVGNDDASDNADSPERRSEITFNVTSGTTYYIAVVGWDAQWGHIALNANFIESAAPSITTHPQSVTVNVGTQAQFSVAAIGGGTLNFVWQTAPSGSDTWSAVASSSGGTTATYSFTPTVDQTGSRYRCVVSNVGGSVTSNAATLTVNAPSGVIGLSAGAFFTHFLKRDGTLWAVGRNALGELGDGTTTDRYTPVQIATEVAYVAPSTFQHTLFIKRDGSLWAVGANGYGQLGDGTTSNRPTPVKIADGVIAAAAGAYHSAFIKADRTLWMIGANWGGQLGNGTQVNKLTPVQVATGAVAVSAGSEHTVFIREDGSLWGMGSDVYGELAGNPSLVPVQITSNVAKVSAGYRHTLFVKSDGTLWGVGENYTGALGVGTNQSSFTTPIQISASVAQVSAGSDYSLFITTDNNLWAAGKNNTGQLGIGSTANKNTLQLVASNAATVSAGYDHSLMVKKDSGLWSAGSGTYGQLGDSGTSAKSLTTLVSTGYISVPAAPTGLTALTPVRGALLQWALSPDASHYEVRRHTTNNSAQATLVARNLTTPVCVDLDAAVGTTYYYWVRAMNPGGASAFSAPLTVQTAANRAPSASFSVGSGPRVLGDTVTISLTVDDPDGNFAYANLWVSTPNRGWMAIKADNTTVATSTQSADHAVATSAGTFTRTFTLSTADGAGVYTFALAAVDSSGAVTFAANQQVTVTASPVVNNVPTASFSVGDQERHIGDTVTISLTVADADGNFAYANLWVQTPNGNWYAIKADNSRIATSVLGAAHATTTSAGTFTRSFVVTSAGGLGSYVFALAAVDQSGAVTFATNKHITVVAASTNQPPTASLSVSSQRLIGETITLTGTVADPDSNLAYANLWVQTPAGSWFAIKADNTLVATSATGAAHAAATTAGTFTRTFAFTSANGAGTYVFALAAVDQEGATGFAVNRYVTVSAGTPPVFTTQPQSLAVPYSATPSFTVATTGAQPITYQWQRYRGTWENATGFPYVGDTTTTLTIESTTSVWNNERYRCIATNAAGSTTSAEATLTLTVEAPTVSAPESQTVRLGTSFTVTASVTSIGGGTLTLQWQKDGVNIPGATNSSYTVAIATEEDAGSYRLVATNSAGSTTSTAAVVRIISDAAVTRVAAGDRSSYLLLDNGQLWTAGAPSGSTTSEAFIFASNNVVGVDAGLNHSLFWTQDGKLYHRGRLFTGGEGANYNTPLEIATGVVAATCGSNTSYYITSDGTLWGVGSNTSGQLGNGTTTSSTTPVQIAQNVQQVAAGASYVLFLKSDGTVWGTGSNASGQLGDGTFQARSTPVQVATGVRFVATGIADSLSFWITTDGRLFATGDVGVLGLTGPDNQPTATALQVDTNVVFVAGSAQRVLYVKNDGTLWGRGINSRGELGDGSGTGRRVSTQLATNVLTAAGGDGHTLLLTPGGSVATTGLDANGQLGNGATETANQLAFANVWTGVSMAPGAVSALVTTDSLTSHVRLTWQAVFSASSYEVWRNTTANFDTATRVAANVPHAIYYDTMATSGVTYNYWIRAVNGAGTSTVGNPTTGKRAGTPPNSAPTASFTLSAARTLGATVTISATVGDVDNNFAYANLWVRTPTRGWMAIKVDNSTTATDALGSAHAAALSAGSFARTFTFTDGEGTYLFALAAVDTAGLVTFATNQYAIVTTANQAPTASFTLSNAQTIGSTVTISGNVADADGNFVYANLWVKTPNNGWRAIQSDNSTGASDSLGAATATTTTAGAFTRTFTFTNSDGLGTYLFALAATDSSGAVTFAPNQYVTVSAAASTPPTASFSLSSERAVNSSITVSLTVGDTDGDFAYANLWVMTPTQGWFAIKSDGSLTATSALSSAHATATSAGSYTRTFALTSAGTYLFALAAVDGAGQTTFASNQYVTVTSANQAPAASFTLSSERTIGQTITISGSVSDADNNFAYADLWVMSPGRGWMAIKSDSSLTATSALGSAHATTTATGAFTRTFTFTNADEAGTYLFALAAVDSAGATTFASNQYIAVAIAGNQAPAASFTLSGERTIGQTITISGNVSDADENLAYANLWVKTPNRGWIAIKSDNSVEVTDALGAAHATTTAAGAFSRTLTFTSEDGAGSYIFALAAVDSAGLTTFATNQYVSIAPAPNTGLEVFGLTGQTPTSYARWAQEQFTPAELRDPAVSGPDAVLGDDGFTNVFKYGLGLPAKSPVTHLPVDTVALDADWFFTFVRSGDRDDVHYEVEVSVDGSDWTVVGVTLEPVDASDITQTWQAHYQAAPGQTVQFRLLVTLAGN